MTDKGENNNVATRTKHEGLQIAGFCSGIGMLETALETALGLRGVPSQSCYHGEFETVTASVLRRFIDASGGESLIYGDMFTSDCSGLRGKVDAVVAGLPCPAFSCSGKQKGNSDSRAWGEDFNPADESTWGPQPHYLRLAEQILPGIVIIENVPQYLTGGHYAPVGEVLYRMGYEYQDAILGTASSVGGSHKRERCFIMAVHRDYDIRTRLGEIGGVMVDPKMRRSGGILRNLPEENEESSRSEVQHEKEMWERDNASEKLAQECKGIRWRGGSDAVGNRNERQVQAEGLCGALADSGHQHSDLLKREVRDESERSGGEVADSSGAGCEGDERGSTHGEQGQTSFGSTAKRREELGDCERQRHQGGCNESGDTPTEGSYNRCGTLPIHAPGIEAYMAWAVVARVDPTRMPSIERGLSVVASEPAVSNVDLLRIGGNCVDALEATACIGCLIDRWLEGC